MGMGKTLLDKWIAKFGKAKVATFKKSRESFLTECFMGVEYQEAYKRYLPTADQDSAHDFAVALIGLVNDDFPSTERPNGKGYQHLERMVEVLSAKVVYDDRQALNKLLGESKSAIGGLGEGVRVDSPPPSPPSTSSATPEINGLMKQDDTPTNTTTHIVADPVTSPTDETPAGSPSKKITTPKPPPPSGSATILLINLSIIALVAISFVGWAYFFQQRTEDILTAVTCISGVLFFIADQVLKGWFRVITRSWITTVILFIVLIISIIMVFGTTVYTQTPSPTISPL